MSLDFLASHDGKQPVNKNLKMLEQEEKNRLIYICVVIVKLYLYSSEKKINKDQIYRF